VKARALLKEGRLNEAIESLGAELRSDPTDAQRRTFLFELLAFAGEFDRAEKQLDVLAGQGQEASLGALLYRSAIHAERIRQKVFLECDFPASAAPEGAVTGTLNGRPFRSLTDADRRIGARLEVFAAGQYTWLPFAHIKTVRMQAPARLRDLIWPAAKILTGAGFKGMELGEVILPALAPRSAESDDDAVRLGRATEWVRWEDGAEAPVGQKLLLVDGEEFPFLELRELQITHAADG
jgi:type VI secretion system protein ImpE